MTLKCAKANTSPSGFAVTLRGLYVSWDAEGVIANPETAAKWYEKAAGQGSAKARYNLAHLLQLGEGVARGQSRWRETLSSPGVSVLSGRRRPARPARLRARIKLLECAFIEGEVYAG